MNKMIPKKNKKPDEHKIPFKKKKKIKIPLEDLTALPSEEEFGDEFH